MRKSGRRRRGWKLRSDVSKADEFVHGARAGAFAFQVVEHDRVEALSKRHFRQRLGCLFIVLLRCQAGTYDGDGMSDGNRGLIRGARGGRGKRGADGGDWSESPGKIDGWSQMAVS